MSFRCVVILGRREDCSWTLGDDPSLLPYNYPWHRARLEAVIQEPKPKCWYSWLE